MSLTKFIEQMQSEIIEQTKNLIAIPSIEKEKDGDMPFGAEVQASLEFVLNLCDSLGFKTKNVDNYAGFAEIGEGEDLIGILVHLDVVPAGDLSKWKYPPYEPTIVDGKLYGRGTIDDKGPAIAAIYALKAILDTGKPLNKRVRIIFGTNEETGSKGIEYYLQHEEIPSVGFTPDADFPVIHGEKGIILFTFEANFSKGPKDNGIEVLKIKGGHRPNMVPDTAEAHLVENQPFQHIVETYAKEKNIKIECTEEKDYVKVKVLGKSAHGSTPEEGVNAISHLMILLSLLDLQVGDLSNFIRFYSNHINLEYNGESVGCNFSDDISGKLIFNVGTVDIDQTKGSIGVNIRYPITTQSEEVFDGLEKNLDVSLYNMNQMIKIKKLADVEPIYFEKDSTLVEKLMNVYRKHTSDSTEAFTIGGGTYARSIPNTVAFGPLFPNRNDSAHQANEHIYIEDLIKSTAIYADAILELQTFNK